MKQFFALLLISFCLSTNCSENGKKRSPNSNQDTQRNIRDAVEALVSTYWNNEDKKTNSWKNPNVPENI